MAFKLVTVALNFLLLVMFVFYFIGHGLPQHPILWASATLWFVTPVATLLFIRKSQ